MAAVDLTVTARRLARAAALLAAATVASRILGLIREVVAAALFGASNDRAAYVVAYSLPFFVQRLLLGGTLSIVFIPTITEYLSRGDREETARVGSMLFNLVLAVGLVMVLAGEVLAPLLVRLAAPGFAAQPGLLTQAAQLTRIIFVAMLFLALSIFATGFLQANQRFTTPALAPLLFNVVVIAATLWLGPRIGVAGLAAAWVLGTAVQFGAQLPAMRRAGFRYLPALTLRHPAVRTFLRLAGPAALGLAVLEINAYVARFFASFLPPRPGVNAVAVLDYAYEVMQAPVGIFAISLATVVFPTLARQAAAADRAGLRASTAFGLRVTLVLILPVVALLLALAPWVIRLIFERGEFTAAATAAVASALRAYVIGLTGVALYYVATRTYYATQDLMTPVRIGGAMVLLNIAATFLLMRAAGATGIALATSLVNLTSAGLLLVGLRRRLGGLEGIRMLRTAGRTAAAAALGGVVAAATAAWGAERIGVGMMEGAGLLAVAGGLGAAVFLAVTWVLNVDEIRALRDLLLRRAPGRRPRARGLPEPALYGQLLDSQRSRCCQNHARVGIHDRA